jgi:hypothetical protein
MRRPLVRGAKGIASASWSFLDFLAFLGLTFSFDSFLMGALFFFAFALSTGGVFSSTSFFNARITSSDSDSEASGDESSFKFVVDFWRFDRLSGESSVVPLLRFRLWLTLDPESARVGDSGSSQHIALIVSQYKAAEVSGYSDRRPKEVDIAKPRRSKLYPKYSAGSQ